MRVKKVLRLVLACFLIQTSVVVSEAQELGNIVFPNSGSEAAQADFLTGVKALHSFQFDDARFAFERAQKADPSFALAYWGQAMSDNHPLWAQQDIDAATAALNRLAPSAEARLARVETEKEKAFMTAVEVLYYSPGDKLQRDFAYSEHMARMYERWPNDDEVSIFYALSLLGTVRPGDDGYRRQALAASISQKVFARNELHPGAAHFIIHSFDDPDHAILALPAAEVYAEIAPAAAHALHMPSHIFLQLGMWPDVVDSNIDAYAAAVNANKKFGTAEGREDFHTLSWLAYANLMLGHFDQANKNLDNAKAALDRNPDSAGVRNGYLNMRGRHILETGQWVDVDLPAAGAPGGNHANWVSVIGMSAVHLGNSERASAAIARLAMIREKMAAAGRDYDAKKVMILEKEVMAVLSLANGDADKAIAAAREAAEMEVTEMKAPSGPPDPMKPAVELYADVLLAADRPVEAISAYERSLQWIPKRTPSANGLEKAASMAGSGDSGR